eukprot:6227159-Prymnesium_polylepis.2
MLGSTETRLVLAPSSAGISQLLGRRAEDRRVGQQPAVRQELRLIGWRRFSEDGKLADQIGGSDDARRVGRVAPRAVVRERSVRGGQDGEGAGE